MQRIVFALALVWTLLPTSCVILLLFTSWLAVVGSRQQSRWRRRVSLLLSAIALGAWLRLRYWDGLSFIVEG